MKIAIVGAGGHGGVVYDCLRLRYGSALEVAFFDDRYPQQRAVFDAPIRGWVEELLQNSDFAQVFVAIGNNRARWNITRRLLQAGKALVTVIHPHTAISPYAQLGQGAIAVAGAVVNANAKVGSGVILNTQCSVGHDGVVGDYAQVAPGANLGGGVVVGEGAFLGMGAKVAPYVRIGAWSVIGAGAVVLKDVPARTFCSGIPARDIRPLAESESGRDDIEWD